MALKPASLKRFSSVAHRRTLFLDALIVGVLVVTIVIGLRSNSQSSASTCEQAGRQHRVAIANDRFMPQSIAIARCDTIVIENTDQKASYNLNFGRLEAHQVYPGYQASTLIPGESITIDAFVAGTYQLHDHFRDSARLDLTINE